MFCWKCGAQIGDTASFCEHCGVSTNPQQAPAPVSQPQYQQPVINIVNNNNNVNKNINGGFVRSGKSKIVALVLCVMFGLFGAHRFYVGKSGSGLLYLFTMGLFGIGWLVDIVAIIIGGFTDKYGYRL